MFSIIFLIIAGVYGIPLLFKADSSNAIIYMGREDLYKILVLRVDVCNCSTHMQPVTKQTRDHIW